jgi:homotetrameric cytidine deaminase
MDWQTDDEAARELLDAALSARAWAHAPYSNFAVGAAVLLADGTVVAGCNVENASYGLTVCAERVAIQTAVARGMLAGGRRIRALAVVGPTQHPLTPCGACRQVLAEFASADCPVWCANLAGNTGRMTLGELLPSAFDLGH